MPNHGSIDHLSPAERRLLRACARCGPVPPRIAHKYFWLSGLHLDHLVEQGILVKTPDIIVPACLRQAFLTHRQTGLPVRTPAYTASRRALAEMERRRWIRGWYRLQGARGSAHDLRLLACYLHAPRIIRDTWLCEREVLDAWFRAQGLAGTDRARSPRPRVPDAACREAGRWVALEVHNEARSAVSRHPDVRAKRDALLGGDAYPGWWDEFRVVTLRGAVHRYFPDGRTQVVEPSPDHGPAPDGVWPFYWDERFEVARPLGTPLTYDDPPVPWVEDDRLQPDEEEDDWYVDETDDIR